MLKQLGETSHQGPNMLLLLRRQTKPNQNGLEILHDYMTP